MVYVLFVVVVLVVIVAVLVVVVVIFLVAWQYHLKTDSVCRTPSEVIA